MIKRLIGAAAVCVLAVACSVEKGENPLLYGEINLQLSSEPTVDVVTKTTLSADEAADYNVAIYSDEALTACVYGPVKYSAFVAQKLPIGTTYYVTAENCTVAEAEGGDNKVGMKRLFGVDDVTLTVDDLEQTATVNCTVSNALVEVAFDASLYNGETCLIGNLQVVLTTMVETEADVFTKQKSYTVTPASKNKSAWFNPAAKFTYTITGVYNPSGNSTKNITVSGEKTGGLKAKDNIKLNVKLNLSNGQIEAPTITVDETIADQESFEPSINPYN